MKIQSIQQQNNSFRGNPGKVADFFVKHPGVVAGLASASVITQKLVLSASELAVAPAMDIAIGKTITKITDEKDGRTNQSSKLQAIRTTAQTIGGTIVGIAVRAVCIGLMTSTFVKGGQKIGTELAKAVNPKSTENLYEITKRAGKLGRDIGGALSVAVMMYTNFAIDVHLINYINKKISDGVDYVSESKKNKEKVNG